MLSSTSFVGSFVPAPTPSVGARVAGSFLRAPLSTLGLIVGLKGTGDGGKYLPTIRSLATVMQYMRSPLLCGPEELKDATNVALVMVTATVPAGGAHVILIVIVEVFGERADFDRFKSAVTDLVDDSGDAMLIEAAGG